MYTATGVLERNQKIEQFVPLVKRMAHHLLARLPASVQADDLIQAGMIGLMDAAGRFEEGHGAQFETYASQRIKGAMLDELRSNDWMPRGVRKAQRDIEKAIGKLEHRLGRPPAELEVAKEMDVSLSDYQEMLAEARGAQLVHFDEIDSEDDNEPFLDRNSVTSGSDPLEQLKDARFKRSLVAAIEGLPEREKMLMGLYYEQELNFKEIAAVLGVTESRICQLHSQAVARIRVKLKDW
ncbi:MAG TPA: RNA polymerase sigma factor FliA [Burkholderiales bacterium]|jgi:RNA polymerase sigma factor for flagellar operon FliA|nr:RNA polymerase sigma factor FliA [Burkholderiales bacterium]